MNASAPLPCGRGHARLLPCPAPSTIISPSSRPGPISATPPSWTSCARHGLSVNYKPVSLGSVFAQTGGLPLPQRPPARQRYRLVELQRWRDRRGLAFNIHPKHWPFDVKLADRFAIAIQAAHGDPDPFLRRAFAAIWEEERNLAEPEVIAAVAREAGLDPRPALRPRPRHDRGGALRPQPRERARGRRVRLAGLCARRRGLLGPGPSRAPRRRPRERTEGLQPRDRGLRRPTHADGAAVTRPPAQHARDSTSAPAAGRSPAPRPGTLGRPRERPEGPPPKAA